MNHRNVSTRLLFAILQFTEIQCNLLELSFFRMLTDGIVLLLNHVFQDVRLTVRQWCSLLKYFYILKKITLVDLMKQNVI